MLEYCREQASPAIQTIAEDIVRSRNSEEGLDLASLSIPPIGGDLANGDAFLLWDALGRESNCPSLIHLLGLASDDSTRVMIAKRMKTLNLISRDFAKDIKRAKKKLSITARLCALLSGGKRSSSSRSAEQALDEEVLHGTTIYIITINISCYQEDMIMRDDACDTSSDSCACTTPSPSGSSSASYTSSRQAMEQVMDAVVDVDVDVAISQPSQLSLVYLEANEAPALRPTGNNITATRIYVKLILSQFQHVISLIERLRWQEKIASSAASC
jgi:hypothetical protein